MTEENTEATEAQPEVETLLTETESQPTSDFTQGKPEDFPEEFWDMEKNSPNVDSLFKAFQNRDKIAKDLRVKLSRGEFTGKPPEDINEYTVEMGEELAAMIPSDDPLMAAAKQAAKDAGLPKDAFSKFMAPVLTKLAEFKASAETPPTEEEIAEHRRSEIAKLGASGEKIVAAVASYGNIMKASGKFSEADYNTFKSMANSAEAIRVLNIIRADTNTGDQVPLEMAITERASANEISTKMAQAMAAGNEAEYNKYAMMLAKLNQ